MPPPSTRRALLHSRLTRIQAALRRLKTGDMRAVPALSHAIRRLRDLLPVVQIDRAATTKAQKVLRRTSRRLKPVARIDALLGLTDDLAATLRGLKPAETRLKADLRRRRTDLAVPEVVEQVRADLTKTLARLKLAAADPSLDRESVAAVRARRWAIKARATRRATELKRALAEAGGVYVPGRLRALQRAAARMWRDGELLATVDARVKPADLKMLADAEAVLEQLRQGERLIACIRKLQGVVTPSDLKAWKELDEVIVPLELRNRQLHGRYVRQRDALALAADRLGARAATHHPSRRKAG